MYLIWKKYHLRLPIILISNISLVPNIIFASANQHELAASNQIVTESSLILMSLILLLTIAYFIFKTLVYRTIILVTSVTFIALVVSITIEKLDFNNYLVQQKFLTNEKVNNIRSRLQSQIQADLQISQALGIFMKSKDFNFSTTEFNNIAQNIKDSAPRIMHFATAKDFVINRVYPVSGNLKAIGLNFRENKQQWPSIERAVNSRKTLLAGPVYLVQGGVAFIGRIPIFYSSHINSDDADLWGIVSVVIDMHALFDSAGLNTHDDLHIALRGHDALGSNGRVFLGDENLFSQAAIIQGIALPVGSWQIAAIPSSGWPDSSPAKLTIRLSVFAFFFLAIFFIIFRASQHIKQAKIHKKLVKEIAERKQLEVEQEKLTQTLFQAQKLEAIGKLTGGIAHDFNNILAAIYGYTQLSKVLLDKNTDPEKLSLYLDEVIKASDRAKKLVQQMLAFSRGKDIQSQPISPHVICKETLSMLESTIPSTINLSTSYYNEGWIIKSDPIQFQQIILNLIVNSRDAITDQIGDISLEIASVNLKNKQCSSCKEKISDQYLQIKVTDSGCGISEKNIEHIFEPFYSTKDVGKGTGMGLSVVHGIVHSAGGHIILTSIPNTGTTVKLLFPILDIIENEDNIIESDPEPEKIQLNKSEGHILIIDDEVSITNLYEDFLSEMGMKTTVFNNPIDAINFFKNHSSDITLVMTDQTMPKMTGTVLSSIIRQLNPDVPIILCSGNTDVIDEEKKASSGVSIFLQKPVDLSLLSKEITNFHS